MTSSEHTRATEHEHEKAGSPSAAAHVLESRPIPRAGDYEAQYFDTKETPNLVAISRIGNPTGLAVVSFSTSLTIIGLALLQISDITLTSSFGAVGGEQTHFLLTLDSRSYPLPTRSLHIHRRRRHAAL